MIRGGDAVFSPDNHYRYLLTRRWGFGDELVTFIGLMPGVTGDRLNDDRVTSKCGQIARSMGMDGFQLVNLFARCVPSWEDLERDADPVGSDKQAMIGDNDEVIFDSCRQTKLTVCAWGSKGALNGRDAEVLQLVKIAQRQPFCLAQQDGFPYQVPFVDTDTELRRYVP